MKKFKAIRLGSQKAEVRLDVAVHLVDGCWEERAAS
jgi:hypothetical protein